MVTALAISLRSRVGNFRCAHNSRRCFGVKTADAAHELNGPTFAHAILTTKELVSALGKT